MTDHPEPHTEIEDMSPAALSAFLSRPDVWEEPEAELERLFEPFYRQADNTRKGAGVGLAITAQGVQLMGGAVKASNQKGGGLCIEITLPLAGAE